MTAKRRGAPRFDERKAVLDASRNLKMARSAHAYVRGNTRKFYEWLGGVGNGLMPQGPPVWICGDCHIGNLGPVANAEGDIEVQIRDLDQTVIGNPAHDLIRLGLSLATAARGSDLPGVTTARMMEQMMDGYERTLGGGGRKAARQRKPESIQIVMRQATARTWKHLAKERIDDTRPTIPLGKRFWPLSKAEKTEITALFRSEKVRRLVTNLHSRDDDAAVELLDAAYWMKGCSSLGRLRFAVLLGVTGAADKDGALCLIDIKEPVQAAAPRAPQAEMPRDNAERVIAGARHLSPFLGNRMLADRFLGRPVVLRELRPQDLKIEIDKLPRDEAMGVARYLAAVVGEAHGRQMDAATRQRWRGELKRNRSKTLDAPSWLWSSVVDLVASHEAEYLEHCRRYSLAAPAA